MQTVGLNLLETLALATLGPGARTASARLMDSSWKIDSLVDLVGHILTVKQEVPDDRNSTQQ